MDAMELKIARIRKKKSAKDLAFAIGKSTASYNKKERGEVRFSSDEIATVTKELELTPEQVNAIFLTITYRFGKFRKNAYQQLKYSA